MLFKKGGYAKYIKNVTISSIQKCQSIKKMSRKKKIYKKTKLA